MSPEIWWSRELATTGLGNDDADGLILRGPQELLAQRQGGWVPLGSMPRDAVLLVPAGSPRTLVEAYRRGYRAARRHLLFEGHALDGAHEAIEVPRDLVDQGGEPT